MKYKFYSIQDSTQEHIENLKVESRNLGILIQAESLKEYDAKWLDSGKKVIRDSSGKFASKGKDSSDVKNESENPDMSGEQEPAKPKAQDVIKETATTFSEALKAFAGEQMDIINSQVLEQTRESLGKLFSERKEIAKELVSSMFSTGAKRARKELAELMAPISTDFSKAIKPDPFQEVAIDIKRLQSQADLGNVGALVRDLPEAFSYAFAKYNSFCQQLKDTPEEDGPEILRLAGKIGAAAIPISVFLAATVAPHFIIAGLSTTLTHMVAHGAAGAAVAHGAAAAHGAAGAAAALGHVAESAKIGLYSFVASAIGMKLQNKALNDTAEALGIDGVLKQAFKIIGLGSVNPWHGILSNIPGFSVLAGGIMSLSIYHPIKAVIGEAVLPGDSLLTPEEKKKYKEEEKIRQEASKKLDELHRRVEKANQLVRDQIEQFSEFTKQVSAPI